MIVPHRTPIFLPWLFPSSLTWRFKNDQRELYLTFDDGPVPGPTDFVLDTLRSFNCKATFFCIGDNVRKHPEIYEKIVIDGHAVGNHTFNHLNGWNTKNERYLENVQQCDAILGPRVGTPLFRPPYGRIKWSQIKGLSSHRIIMWDVLTVDYDRRLEAERCLQNSINATRPGSIIVFHDSFKAERNMKFALPRYIEHFLNQGYAFKRIA